MPRSSAAGEAGVDLEHATQLQGEAGRYRANLSEAWEIWGPNGGYLAALALRAAGLRAEIQIPRSFYCHFLSSPAFAPVEIEVSVLRSGRRAESFAVHMSQQGKPVLHALVKTAAVGPGHRQRSPASPSVSAPSELAPYEDIDPRTGAHRFAFWRNIERRLASTHGEPVLREWTRYRPRACFEDPFTDAARSLILLDTYGFPAAYRRHRSTEYLAPNLDTSAWFHRASPSSEWLLIEHECFAAEDGLLAVSGRVWDPDGTLLATGAAQLCCIETASGGSDELPTRPA